MKLDLVTLTGSKFSGEVYEAQLPTTSGPIAVYPGHQPLVTLMGSGVITIRKQKNDPDSLMDDFATNAGIAEIDGNSIKILVDEADHSDEITQAEAEKALERAKELKRSAKGQVELDKAQAMIDRYAVRLKVAGLRRRKQR